MRLVHTPKLYAIAFILVFLFSFPRELVETARGTVEATTGSSREAGTGNKADLDTSLQNSRGFAPVNPAFAKTPVLDDSRQSFLNFVAQVSDGKKGVVRGIYVPGAFALHVVQQPADEWSFVSDEMGTVTQFRNAADNGITGLLAHNYLSGELFYKLFLGQEIRIIYGNGIYRSYQVARIYRFEKLDPSSLTSDMINLSTGKVVTTDQVFNDLYTGSNQVTLQTCLYGEGRSNWGLYFVIAIPVQSNSELVGDRLY